MTYVIIITMLILVQYTYFGMEVGRARGRTGIKAPATSGNEEFERYYRVHENTLEQIVVIIPAMFAFSHYYDSRIAAGLGVIFLAARMVYFLSYVKDPSSRSLGFSIGFTAQAVLVIGALAGALMTLV